MLNTLTLAPPAAPTSSLRPYQAECVAKVSAKFREHSKLLVVIPTDGGKTIVFSHMAARARGRVLIVTHREELLQQAQAKLHSATGIVADLERADSRASLDAKVVVASVQTLCGRFTRFPADHFSLAIADEAHHTLAESYQGFLGHFLSGGAKVLGVTATPGTRGKMALGKISTRTSRTRSVCWTSSGRAISPPFPCRPFRSTLGCRKRRPAWGES